MIQIYSWAGSSDNNTAQYSYQLTIHSLTASYYAGAPLSRLAADFSLPLLY